MFESSKTTKPPMLPNTISENGYGRKIWIILLAVSLRAFSFKYLADFFEQLPTFSTPWNDLKRLKEGVFLLQSGRNPYEGDLFHNLPIFAYAFRIPLDYPLLLRIEWTLFDLFCAHFLSKFVSEYIKIKGSAYSSNSVDSPNHKLQNVQSLSLLAFSSYLLNPMTIGCWTICNLSALVNLFVSAVLYFSIRGHLLLSTVLLAFCTQLNPYYVLLMAPILLQFSHRKIAAISLYSFPTLLLLCFNLFFDENWRSDMFRNTIGFFLSVPDLTPNTGIFWYFFTQVFEHYRALFLCVFQLNVLIYIVPLSVLMRKNPAVLSSILLIVVALFTPYPSYAETALYLSTLTAFFDLHKYLRHRLVTGSAILATFVLTPLMWCMWVQTGSGNANFFFAIVWVFSLAQIFISSDLISAFLRSEIVEENGGEEEVEKRFEGLRLLNVSPF